MSLVTEDVIKTGRSCVLPANSQLEQLIRAHLDTPPAMRRASGTRTIFLPWYSSGEHESETQVKTLAQRLTLKVIILPSHYSLTYDPRLLGELIDVVYSDRDNEQGALLRQALRELPYSPALERTVLRRLSEPSRGKRVAIAALKSGDDADSSVSRMLDWIRALQLESVLVFAHRRPGGNVETVRLPLHRMVQDVIRLVPDMVAPTPAPGSEQVAVSRSALKPQASFYSRLRAYLLSLLPAEQGKSSLADPRKEEADPPAAPFAESIGRWAELLARLSGANWAAAEDVSAEWRKLGELINERIPAKRDAHSLLYLDNEEELETFGGRLRFLVLLRVLYPRAFAAAAHELDGADQLYRIHLTLCGAAAKDSLLAHSLLPFWRGHLEDPLFCELFYACFLTVERDRPLTERFESRSQLHRLLLWLDASEQEETEAEQAMRRLVSCQSDWLRALSGIDHTPKRSDEEIERTVSGANRTAVADMCRLAKDVLNGEPFATEALQAAQILMSICELLTETQIEKSESLHKLIDALTLKAINQSAGAVRFDASLLRARSLALRGQAAGAFEILRIMRRMSRDALGRCAAQIEEAYVHEREHNFARAIALYEGAMSIAEDLGADELVARAASGCLRCEASAEMHKPGADQPLEEVRRARARALLHLRARITLQIQCARAPELFPLTSRDKPTLFVSYRAESRSVTRALVQVLNEERSELRAWTDVELKSHQDLNPTIHRRLHDADAIVILLSPEYFESAWCVAELHFALSQNEIRGVPLCWLWCSSQPDTSGEPPDAKADLPCEILAWRAIRRGLRGLTRKRHRHERAHIEERLRRVFSRARLLNNRPVYFTQNKVGKAGEPEGEAPEFPQQDAYALCEPLRQMAPYLYARAKLLRNRSTESNAG